MFLVEHQHLYLHGFGQIIIPILVIIPEDLTLKVLQIPLLPNFSVGVIADDNKLMLELDAPYILTTDFDLEQWNHVVVPIREVMIIREVR